MFYVEFVYVHALCACIHCISCMWSATEGLSSEKENFTFCGNFCEGGCSKPEGEEASTQHSCGLGGRPPDSPLDKEFTPQQHR